MRYVVLFVAALLWSGSAMAQHKHENAKGPNGGPMQDVVGVHAELITAGNLVTVNLVGEKNKPVSSKGFTGSALIVSGAEQETVVLVPSGDFALKGEAKKAIAAGSSISVTLKNAVGMSGQVKY